MNSRELVRRAIEFQRPSRLPLLKGRDPDVIFIGYGPPSGFVPPRPGMDEWGCVWRTLRGELGDKGQVVEHPLADATRVSEYRFLTHLQRDASPGWMNGFEITLI